MKRIVFIAMLFTSFMTYSQNIFWSIEPNKDEIRYLGSGNFYTKEADKEEIIGRYGMKIPYKKASFDSMEVVLQDWTTLIVKKNGKYALSDMKGNLLTELKYDEIITLSANDMYGFKENNLWGIIKNDGSYLSQPIYQEIKPVKYNGVQYIWAKNWNNKVTLYSKTIGDEFSAQYDDLKILEGGFYVQIMENSGIGLMSRYGSILIEPEYYSVKVITNPDTFFIAKRELQTIKNKREGVMYEGKRKIIGVLGNRMLFTEKGSPLKFVEIINGEYLSDNITEIEHIKYLEYKDVTDGKILVRDEKGWTYLDDMFSPMTNLRYNYASNFYNSLAVVTLNNEVIVINNKFQVLLSINTNNPRSIAQDIENAMQQESEFVILSIGQKKGVLKIN